MVNCSGQEYSSTLLLLTGDEYDAIPFAELHERLCSALRVDLYREARA